MRHRSDPSPVFFPLHTFINRTVTGEHWQFDCVEAFSVPPIILVSHKQPHLLLRGHLPFSFVQVLRSEWMEMWGLANGITFK